jgi:hypothetical protein
MDNLLLSRVPETINALRSVVDQSTNALVTTRAGLKKTTDSIQLSINDLVNNKDHTANRVRNIGKQLQDLADTQAGQEQV